MSLASFTLVQDLAGLKALAHPERLHILRALWDEPGGAAVVGRGLELAPQKVGRHIKQLEAVGLVRFTGTGWKEERRCQAVAHKSLMDPALGCDDSSTLTGLAAELELRFREGSLARRGGAACRRPGAPTPARQGQGLLQRRGTGAALRAAGGEDRRQA
jgi:DNA-binding transcriptional ArsR family regulator